MRGVLIIAGVALALVALPVAAQSPPKDLKLVGDHWTAWDPPAEVAEGAQVYTIQRGDTLWDLAQQFYDNPYLWPQIWEQNRYILDSHWIYPGDPLVVGYEVESSEVLDRPTGDSGESVADAIGEEFEDGGLFGRRSGFQQLGSEDDIYCSGYIGELAESFGVSMVGSEYDVLGPTLRVEDRGTIRGRFGLVDAIKIGLDVGDVVYLNGGRDIGLSAGDRFSAVEPRDLVRHPETNKVLGRFYEYQGVVRVLSVQDNSAIAEISSACSDIAVSASLKPFEPIPIPSERRTPLRPVNDPASAESLVESPMIIYGKDGLFTLGQDHVVFVDRGESDGVEPGLVYTVYRENTTGNPPVVLGEVAILSVHPYSSLAKVIESRYPIYVGDRLEQK
ncbi:MAG: LysM peptidoglycan-binding domain-containing protein [Acidobacteriota bacterium]